VLVKVLRHICVYARECVYVLDKRALRLRRPALRPCETMMKNDCVTGRVLSLHRILKQTVPRVLSFIDHGLSSGHPSVGKVTLGLADKHNTNTIGDDWIFRRTFQCATVGGPVTSQYSSSMLSLAALLRPRRSMSRSASWADFFDASGEPSPMLPLSRLLCLLEGGVSGMRGPGMFWGLEDSVGRRQAGV
jgi:hypothetical protein